MPIFIFIDDFFKKLYYNIIKEIIGGLLTWRLNQLRRN